LSWMTRGALAWSDAPSTGSKAWSIRPNRNPGRALEPEHTAEQELASEINALDRVGGGPDGSKRGGRGGPQPVQCLVDERYKIGEVAVGRGLGNPGRLCHGGHRHPLARLDHPSA
jgi:hypothetical protein